MTERTDRYPALIPLLFFIAGLELYARAVDPAALLVASGLTTVLLTASRTAREHRLQIAVLFLTLGLGIAHREARALERRDAALASIDEGRFVTVSARVEREWESYGSTRRLRVREFAVTQDGTTHRIDRPLAIWCDEPPPIGDAREISAEGILKRKRDERYSLTVKSPLLIEYHGAITRLEPRFWNRIVSERLQTFAGKSETIDRAIILTRALALGRSDRLPVDLRRSYRNAGTYHLLVFSGMQIAFAAAFLVLALRPFHSPRIADFSLLALSLLAPLFAGSEPSVARSSWMIGCFALSRLLGRPTPMGNLLFVTAMLRLCLVPSDLRDAGFALTYAAAGGIILIGGELAQLVPREWRPLRVIARGLGAEIATTPLSIFYFNRYVIAGSLVTLAIAPAVALMLFSSILLCAAAFLVPSAIAIPAAVLVWLDAGCRAVNDFAAEVLHLGGLISAPATAIVVASFVVFAVLLLFDATRRLAAVVLLAMPAAAACQAFLIEPRTAIRVLDVGQGDATLVTSGPSTLLVDGGGHRDDPGFGERVLIPQLLERGVRRVDAVVLTHAHPDHCGGLVDVVLQIPVGVVVVPGRQAKEECARTLLDAAVERRVPVVVAEHTRTIPLPQLYVRLITPRLRFKRSQLNNGSLVLYIRTAELSAVIPGDVEEDGERLLAEEGGLLQADVLKVPHHGSRSSTTEILLEAVRPRVAVISCGPGNLYGHPHEETLARLSAGGVNVHRTDRFGTITVARVNGRVRVEREFDWQKPSE